jgi:TolA-binding protein
MLMRRSLMETIELLPRIAETGLLGVFLVLVIIFLINLQKERHATVREKDEQIKELNESVLNIVKENTQTQTELRKAVEGNTKASETLTAAVYQVLKRSE